MSIKAHINNILYLSFRLKFSTRNPNQLDLLDTVDVYFGKGLSDGTWHFVKLMLSGNRSRVFINLDNKRYKFKMPGNYKKILFIIFSYTIFD